MLQSIHDGPKYPCFSHIGSYARSEDCLISDGPPLLEDRLRFLPQIGGLSASDRLPPKISKIGLIMRFYVKRSLV